MDWSDTGGSRIDFRIGRDSGRRHGGTERKTLKHQRGPIGSTRLDPERAG